MKKIEKNNKIQENSIALLHQKFTALEERINVLNSTVTNQFNQQNELKKNYNAIELLLKQQGEKQDNQILIKTNHLQAQIDKLMGMMERLCSKEKMAVDIFTWGVRNLEKNPTIEKFKNEFKNFIFNNGTLSRYNELKEAFQNSPNLGYIFQ